MLTPQVHTKPIFANFKTIGTFSADKIVKT